MVLPEKKDAPLVITLFGPLQALLEGQPLPPMRSRKSLWLLALLTLRQSRPVEREWLAGTLWPDVAQSQAFANLRPVLSALRSALGSQKERLQSPDRQTLRLNLSGAEVDLLAFDAAIKSKNLQEVERAITLYRGPMLEGCMEEWAFQERRAREQDCLQALKQLGDAGLNVGDYTRAGGFYQKAAQIDPLWDTARRGVMEALAKNGDRNAALQVYREFVELLRDDPGAAPDEQTTALYMRLRAEARQQDRSRAVGALEPTVAPKVTGFLPHPLTELVGREDERLEVAARLRRSRLVTLTGMGGIGKTRLAMEVAREVVTDYADGVWLVALESLTEGKQVIRQVASALGLSEEPGRPLQDTVTRHLSKRRLLLILDNCEHLLTASREITAHLLKTCRELRILTTSREALEITGEIVWAVPSLTVPVLEHLPSARATLLRVLMSYEGVQLFVERAQAAQKTFALTSGNAQAVAQVCTQLEGIPLALELAAARMKAVTVEQIALRLHDNLGLLNASNHAAPTRQQTLRATLDWSYALLDVSERVLLHRLSVFAGGWTLEAAEEICAEEGLDRKQMLNLLTSLVDKSLVSFAQSFDAPSGADRSYRLLETVRQYAAEKLQANREAGRLKDRHLTWFLKMTEEAAPKLKSSEQAKWLRQLEVEYDNVQAALVWSEAPTQEAERGLRLTGALWWFWKMQGRFSEGRQYLGAALEREGAQGETLARAKALNGAGALAFNQGDSAAARPLHEESLILYRKLGNRPGAAATLNNLGNVERHLGRPAIARAVWEEGLSIYRELDDQQGVATTLSNLGGLVRLQSNYTIAQELYEESLSIRRILRDEQGIALTLAGMGNIARLQGDYDGAQSQLEESLNIRRRLRDRQGIAWTLSHLGSVADARGEYPSARLFFEESLSIHREQGEKQSVGWSLNNLGLVSLHEGNFKEAKLLFEESLAIFRQLSEKGGIAWSLNHLGEATQRSGEGLTAQRHFVDSLNLFQELEDREGVADNLRDLAAVLGIQAEEETAVRLWGAAEALRESIGAVLLPIEQEDYDRQVEYVRSALSANAFSSAWEEGRALTWNQAVATAISVTVQEI